MKNFEFTHNGSTYWYSRAIVCLTAVFCRDTDFNLHVLINKRGTATNLEQHKWNLPVGYLDFDEDTKECAVREIFEETGVKVPLRKIKLFNINSKPDSGRQDVGFRYYAILDGFIDDYPTNTNNMEVNEVESVKWLDVADINSVEFAWNHKDIINEILQKCLPGDADGNTTISYDFRCDDGVTVTIFADKNRYGHFDYADYASYDKINNGEPVEACWIKAYESCPHNLTPKNPTNKTLQRLLSKCKKFNDRTFTL